MTAPASPSPATPSGEVVMRTIAMPADTNNNGDIFGGWLVSQLDLGGAILARSTALSRVTTVAIDALTFHRPVAVGDIVTCYARLDRVGRTSMKIAVEAWVHRYSAADQQQVTSGHFTYVAIDGEGRPHPVKR
ncbi:MAG: acyl-CoA thioesterase [Verrucomicrobiota bacterium]|nr:acyl-CoA thioesterase [Opitutales bacterium]